MAGCLHGSSNEDNDTADEDALPSTIPVCKKATERERRDLAEIVNDEYYPGGGSGAIEAKCALIGLHCVDGSLVMVSKRSNKV